MFVRGEKRMQIYREAYLMGTVATTLGSPKPYGIKGTIIERHIIVVGEVVDFYYLIYIMREDLRNPVSCALGTIFFVLLHVKDLGESGSLNSTGLGIRSSGAYHAKSLKRPPDQSCTYQTYKGPSF